MSKKAPPVPPENQSSKAPRGRKMADAETQGVKPQGDTDQTGQEANTKINTTHQGHQQGR
ncbi:MAG: hypothetical protein NW215_10070 [Hyphomicrobiales bacterium]|nr:hypothetical protein [Hyphomicrobiales bacterium]